MTIGIEYLDLTTTERLVYRLHDTGMTIPQISRETGIAEHIVHSAIVYVWFADKQFFTQSRARLMADMINSGIDDAEA